MMLRDMHLHTDYSDGKSSMVEMIRCAIELGYAEIGFTDHVRTSTQWITEYRKELHFRQKEFQGQIRIRGGVEVKLCNWNGKLDLLDDVYDTGLRIVAAIHRIPNKDGSVFYRRDDGVSKELLQEAWKNVLYGTISNNRIECIAHPFNWERSLQLGTQNETIIKGLLAKSEKLQIEYNVKYDNACLAKPVWQQLRDRVIIGSDSHSVEDMESRNKEIVSAHLLMNRQ